MSVKARLKNIADNRGRSLQQILTNYANERFLYRLSISPYRSQFILKGGTLFVVWQNGETFRPTADADLLCQGNVTEEYLLEVFRVTASFPNGADAMIFEPDSVTAFPIRKDKKHGGVRIQLNGFLANATISLQFDIGVGDVITPSPEWADFPTLLGHPAPRLLIYPMQTVIAEKTEAMVITGVLNSRMKDFFDLWLLSEIADHDFASLAVAMRNTFMQRSTAWPNNLPLALTKTFSSDKSKQIQWSAFLRKKQVRNAPADFTEVVERLATFVGPLFLQPQPAYKKWQKGKGWK